MSLETVKWSMKSRSWINNFGLLTGPVGKQSSLELEVEVEFTI